MNLKLWNHLTPESKSLLEGSARMTGLPIKEATVKAMIAVQDEPKDDRTEKQKRYEAQRQANEDRKRDK